MAKVKTAKQRITDFLKAKGLDAAEVKDAFEELDAADADLDKLADATTKNEQWNTWYAQVAPEIKNMADERETLKGRIAKLEAAGVTFGNDQPAPQIDAGTGLSVSPSKMQEEMTKFKMDIATANSSAMKSLLKVGFGHLKQFEEMPDLDAIETLMKEGKASTIDEAYRMWSRPMRADARTKATEKEITEKVRQGVQDEISKMGIVRPKKRGDVVEQELLNEASIAKSYKDLNDQEKRQYDANLRSGFVSDINSDVTH